MVPKHVFQTGTVSNRPGAAELVTLNSKSPTSNASLVTAPDGKSPQSRTVGNQSAAFDDSDSRYALFAKDRFCLEPPLHAPAAGATPKYVRGGKTWPLLHA